MLSQATLLVQEKLDVRQKSRTNLFNWRGQFTPQFVDYILDSFAKSGECVVDPFSGSGTVLQGCAAKRMRGYGYEISPAAYAMSKFFTLANASVESRRNALESLHNKLVTLLAPLGNAPFIQDSEEYRIRFAPLLNFAASLFAQITDKEEKVLAINTLLMAESRKRKDLPATVFHAFEVIKSAALVLPRADAPIRARLCDSRAIDQYHPSEVSVILTSPPYINVFNYHQNHRAIMETLGWNVLKVAESEIGSNRKNRGNRFRTVVQYCLEMEQTLTSFWQSLRLGGTAIMVVGRESNVRGIPFYNGSIIKDLQLKMGGFQNVATYERQFMNRFGSSIKENIIVSVKTRDQPNRASAREVAERHLKLGLRKSTEDTRHEISDVLEKLTEIQPSLLFKAKEVFANA